MCCFCFSVGLIFSTRAGQFNIYLADLHLGLFCPPILLLIEILFVFCSYGWTSLKGNIVEMTGVDIYNSTFYVFLTLVLLILLVSLTCQALSYLTLLPAIFPPLATLAGAGLTLLPLLVMLWVCLVKIQRTEGKTLRTKLRIVTQSNIEECKCHRLVRTCPYRRSS